MRTITTFLFTCLILSHGAAFCQAESLNAKEWAKRLADPNDLKNEAVYSLGDTLAKVDSVTLFNFLGKLGSEPSSKSLYFTTRYNCLKAEELVLFNPPQPGNSTFVKDSVKRKITVLFEEAMNEAYITDDDYLAAFCSSIYGNVMSNFGNSEKAVTYMMYGAELYEKVHLLAPVWNYIALGVTLWRVREYRKSIYYTKIAISILEGMEGEYKTRNIAMCNNTLGLSYHRMQLYDSAFLYYNRGLHFVSQSIDSSFRKAWKGTISGNMAQIYFVQGKYKTALPLFILDYQTSKVNGYYADAANSLQWAAKTNLALGKKAKALQQVRESFGLLQKWPNPANYLQNAYLTASEIFKSFGNDDSAYYYIGKYNLLHDSLENVIYQSSISISKLRLDNEKNRYNVQNLEREKKAELQTRNLIIAAILLLGAIGLFTINRQRQKSKIKARFQEEEKRRIEQEMESAKAQLKMFTKSIIEKTNLIEKLESQMQNKLKTQEQEQLIEELSRQSILTEEDWLNFKALFEKLYAGFFQKLSKHVNNITQAEQRMTALTLLHLTTKQMAGLLGISPNSVIKAKHRMRDRFNLQTDEEVEDFIASL